ncbi:MAG: hypothetical protein IJR63_12020 [Synergistaceae bacterium]|nr:hypothetical protein [Synergistaceae bacterium]
MNVKQISVVMSNEPGSVLRMARTLSENDIYIRALTVADSSTFSTVRIIVNNVLWASSVLKEAGFTVSLSDVIAAGVPDTADGLAHVLEVLDGAGINIDYMYEIRGNRRHVTGGGAELQIFVFKVSDNTRTVEAFESAGIKIFGQGELSGV